MLEYEKKLYFRLKPIQMRVLPISICCFLLLFLISCKNKRTVKPDNTAQFGMYIQSYGPLSVGKHSDIFIDVKPQLVTEQSAKNLDDFITIEPAVKAEFLWKDGHVLYIDPIEELISNTEYSIQFDIKKYFDLQDAPEEPFTFTAVVIPQLNALAFKDYVLDDNGHWHLDVELSLNDFESLETIRKYTNVSSNGKELNFSIQKEVTKNPIIHIPIPEGTTESIQVSFQGTKIGAELNADYAFSIPQIADLELLETKENFEENTITFIFNKLLNSNQNLDGFIKIKNQTPSYKIKSNALTIFLKKSRNEQEIVLLPGVKAKDGDKLKTKITHTIGETEIKPLLKNVGLGYIIPSSEQVVFPFEAQGLTSVRLELFKIHANNLQQFYQRNTLHNAYNLQYIGEVVYEEKMELNQLDHTFDPFSKKRYFFDLKDFISKDPNSIYEVRIGFLPTDVYNQCAQNIEEPQNLSIFDSDYYGVYGYYNDFDWNDRENPCKKAYYRSDHYIKKLVVNSDIGIIAKKASNGDLIIFANDLNTAEPIQNAKISVFNKAQRELVHTETDGTGRAFLTGMGEAFIVRAQRGATENWLKIEDKDALSMSKFKVAGRVTTNGLDGFIYAERNVWRPGDTMFVDFIIHDPEDRLPNHHPVELKVFNPQGKEVFQQINSSNVGPFYAFEIPTSSAFLTGDYIIQASLGNNTFSKSVKIETIKPNKFSIENNVEQVTDLNQKLREGKVNIPFEVKWLYGAPAKNKELKCELMLRNKALTVDGFSEYRFSDPRNLFRSPPSEMISSVKTDESGLANVSVEFPSDVKAPAMLQVTLKSTAFESSGDFSTDVSTFDYAPYAYFTGIEIPKNQYNYKRVDRNKNATIELVSISDEKQAASGRDLKVKVYRMENYWWYNSYNDKFQLADGDVHVSANSFEVKTNRSGKASVDVTFKTYGRFYIQACDEASGHCTGDYLYVGYPWNDDDMNRSVYEDAAQLNFTSTKTTYNSGETVELNVPSYFQGKALISLENGNSVVESFWTEVQRGNNVIKFTAQPTMFPTIYAHVTMLQAFTDKTTDMPIRSYGVLPITIKDEALLLNPELDVASELKPKQKVDFTVSEENGKAMYYTLAVVDEGLLNITNFKSPDPEHHFYAKPALGVRTIDVYNDVMSNYGNSINQLFSIGGDGASPLIENVQKANRFKSVVQHLGPFYCGAGAQNKHSITLPNYIGNVRFMLVAADKQQYGMVEKNIPVKQDLMVLTTVPRTLAPGDEVDVPLTIFTMKNQIGKIEYGLKTGGVSTTVLDNGGSFISEVDGEDMFRLKAKIGNEEGVVTFNSAATSSRLQSDQTIEVQVENPNPIIRRGTYYYLEGQAQKEFSVVPIGNNKSEYSIAVSSLAPVNMEEIIDGLTRYPYGCLEQRTSAAYAYLFHKSIGADFIDATTADRIVQDHLSALYRFKLNTGFSLWPRGRRYDAWLTSFVGEFLMDAKEKGYGVRAQMIEQWKKDQKAIASNWAPDQARYRYAKEVSIFSQAYRLYTLARADAPAIGEMNRLREDVDLDYNSGLLLAAAYAEAGRKDIAEKVFNKLDGSTMHMQYYRYSYGSPVRNAALRVLLYDALEKENEVAKEMKYLNDLLSEKPYLSTHTSIFVLRAIAAIKEKSAFSKGLQVKLKVGDKEHVLSSETGDLVLKSKFDKETSCRIENMKQSGVFVQVMRRGKENIGTENAASRAISIQTKYYDLENKEIDVADLIQGTDFTMVTTVTRTSTGGVNLANIAVRQAIPSGWEITNDRVTNSSSQDRNEFDYQDIRDSKVHTFINLEGRNSISIRLKLKATYTGSFYHPKVLAESMYSDQVYAEEVGFPCTVKQSIQ